MVMRLAKLKESSRCLDQLLLMVVCAAASVPLPEQNRHRKDRRSNPGTDWFSVRFTRVGMLVRRKWPGLTIVAHSWC